MTPVDVVMAVLPAVGFAGSFFAFRSVWSRVTSSLARSQAAMTPAVRVGSIRMTSGKNKN